MRRVAVLLLGGWLCAPMVLAESDAPPPGAMPPADEETATSAEPPKPIERHFIADDDTRLETLLERLPPQELVRLPLPEQDVEETDEVMNNTASAARANTPDVGTPTVPDAIDDLLGNTSQGDAMVPAANSRADSAPDAADNAKPSTFPGLWIPAEAPTPEGGLIILPGDGLHPDWPQQIHTLREMLPRAGWSTLSLVLPVYQPLTLPVRQGDPVERYSYMPDDASAGDDDEEAAEDVSDETADMPPADPVPLPAESMAEADTVADQGDSEAGESNVIDMAAQLERQQQRVDARLQSAQDWLKAQQVNWNTLVVQYGAAWWLLPRLKNGGWPKHQPLVLLDAIPPAGESAHSLSQALAEAGRRPILDLYNPLNGKEKAAADDRREAYRRAGNDLAVQLPIYLPLTDRQARNAWVAKRIEGWLRQLKKDHPQVARGRLRSERQLEQLGRR